MTFLWVLLTIAIIALSFYLYLANWKTTISVMSTQYKKQFSYYTDAKTAFEAALRQRYGYRKKYALPYVYARQACEDVSKNIRSEKVYNLPNLIFLCLCFDRQSILTRLNPYIVYDYICDQVAKKNIFPYEAQLAKKDPETVFNIHETFCEYITGERKLNL